MLSGLFVLSLISFVAAQNDCTNCIDANKEYCPSTGACNERVICNIIPIKIRLNCPRPTAPQYQYNETFVRGTVLPLMSTVYADDAAAAACFRNAVPTAVFNRGQTVQCAFNQTINATHCYGYTAYDRVNNAIIVGIAGTETAIQLWDEVYSFLDQPKVDFYGVGKVMKYFYDAFFFMWNGFLQQDVNQLLFEHPGSELWVFGPSMGGAIASVMAAYASKQQLVPANKIRLVTFGQPRTGDLDYATFMETAVPYSQRIVHHRDPVPHIPPRTGQDFMFHHRQEVWYNNDMTVGQPYKVCDEADGDYCSNTQVDYKVEEHLKYYDEVLRNFAQVKKCIH